MERKFMGALNAPTAPLWTPRGPLRPETIALLKRLDIDPALLTAPETKGINPSGKNVALTALLAAITHVSAHSAFPGTAGSSELSGGTYARQPVTWGTVAGGIGALSAAATLPIPSGATVRWIAGFTALTGGTCHATVPAGGFDPLEYTVDTTGSLIQLPAHGFAADTTIAFHGGTPPGGLTEGVTYFVRSPTANSFAVGATAGGAAITLTTVGATGCFVQQIAEQPFATAGQYQLTTGTQFSLNF
ncbi:MAG: hypothetical protein RQ833_11570 [Sphingomonadaceae bacterium]|nr:hypothetical protein [Sphingomonadaceae bacterium]